MKNKSEVLAWAKERGLLKPENAPKQMAKVLEEVVELNKAIVTNNKPEIIDGIGDSVVTLIILAEQLGLDIEDCLEAAYNEIKDRKGKLVNGLFVKEADNRFVNTVRELSSITDECIDWFVPWGVVDQIYVKKNFSMIKTKLREDYKMNAILAYDGVQMNKLPF